MSFNVLRWRPGERSIDLFRCERRTSDGAFIVNVLWDETWKPQAFARVFE